jgi:hypothetical protein
LGADSMGGRYTSLCTHGEASVGETLLRLRQAEPDHCRHSHRVGVTAEVG